MVARSWSPGRWMDGWSYTNKQVQKVPKAKKCSQPNAKLYVNMFNTRYVSVLTADLTRDLLSEVKLTVLLKHL